MKILFLFFHVAKSILISCVDSTCCAMSGSGDQSLIDSTIRRINMMMVMVSPNHVAMKRKRARYASSLSVAIEFFVFFFLLLSVSTASSFSFMMHRHGHHHLQHSQASYCNSSGRTTKLHMSNEKANPEEGSVLGASLLFAGEWDNDDVQRSEEVSY